MERWEPPRPTGTEEPRRRRPAPETPPREIPEIWLMVGVRAGITLTFVLTVLLDDLRDLMGFVAVFLIAGLVAVLSRTDKTETPQLRSLTVVDLATLLAVVPVAVLFGFVAAEPGALLPAERSALLQTGGGMLIMLGLIVWLGIMLFPQDRALVPAVLLPGLIAVVSLTFVLHDYRNQTVLAMLAVAYFVGTASIALGAMVDESVRRHVPAVFLGSTILAGLMLFDPGLQNLFDRDGLVQLLTGMMILIGAAVLIVLPNPFFDDLRLSASGRSSRRRPPPRIREEHDDFSRDASERGR